MGSRLPPGLPEPGASLAPFALTAYCVHYRPPKSVPGSATERAYKRAKTWLKGPSGTGRDGMVRRLRHGGPDQGVSRDELGQLLFA